MNDELQRIKKKIEDCKIKCVSFDMFDTLVQRPTLKPEDIFHMVGEISGEGNFFKQRRLAAYRRARLLKDYYDESINIDDIYQHYKLMFHKTDEEIEDIKRIELDLELQLCSARHSIKKLFDFAIHKGKKVIITTDMYLPAVFLEKILVKCEINGYDKLYVSCEENATKRSGMLYEKILGELDALGIYEYNLLHIGDNKKVDIEAAKLLGINTIYIPSAAECFLSCPRLASVIKWESSVYPSSQRLMLGLYANLIFDNPFENFDKNSRYNGERRWLGYFLAPFLVSFCMWLIEEVHKDKIDSLQLVWRDGYIPNLIIEKILPHYQIVFPKIERLFLNRSIRFAFAARKTGGLFDSMYQWRLNPNITIKEFTDKFINCSSDDDRRQVYEIFADHGYTSAYEGIGKIDRYIWFIHEFEEIFNRNHMSNIEIVSNQMDLLRENKKIGVFDIGYRGTVSRFLKEQFGIDSTTYHMLGTMGIDEVVDGVTLKAFVKYDQSRLINTENILHKFLELVISEQEASVLGYEKDGKITQNITDVFFEPDRNVQDIQEGILEYASLFAETFGDYIPYMNIDRNVLFTMINSLLSSPYSLDAKVIATLTVTSTHYASTPEDFSEWYRKKFKGEHV